MTVTIKEYDAAREVEIEVQEGIVYVDSPRSCYAFDRGLFLRAIEREFDVIIYDFAETVVTQAPG